MATTTIIFDLSEVIIAGLLGVEKPLSEKLCVNENLILPAFGGELLQELCRGRISETDFISNALCQHEWTAPVEEIKTIIRQNFHHRVPNMDLIIKKLSIRYELALLSDHAKEWVDYIKATHPFLSIFGNQIFSFELSQTKKEISTFEKALTIIKRHPSECLFIDDSPQNVENAMSVGIPSIRFIEAQQLTHELDKHHIQVG